MIDLQQNGEKGMLYMNIALWMKNYLKKELDITKIKYFMAKLLRKLLMN